ncbi:FkbM family methyltransferase [Cyanobium gracile]|uniref:FkbM family methyltransferase n=1 Tax=Cyanobium gracile UHCC 0281 TaxID=3110309 RepID=A0ABU5SW76_9CYAN|nr:FkbM family methyltransferase [Cyanobium gracile]MEA5442683.1 FkbM family methyltransferase [Cyanobium gracile UHCC 0281]
MAAEHDVDKIVREEFFSGHGIGVLVEVGAARPDYLSISASFRELGWKIIAVEPNPEFCAAHRALGHDVLQYAASDSEEDDASFFVVNSNAADYMGGSVSFESFSSLGIRGKYSELHETVKETTNIETIPVKVRRLDSILAAHEPDLKRIDILAIDVEGWELNVLRGLTLSRYRPKVIILESLFEDPEYVSYMNARGYKRWRRLEPNDVYVRHEPFWKKLKWPRRAVKAPSPPNQTVHSLRMRLDTREVIQSSMADGSYEPTQTAWARECLSEGDRFVDIGANFGWYTMLASTLVGQKGSVFAFEPSPVAAGIIAEAIEENALKNVTLVRAAVGDAVGHEQIYMPVNYSIHSPSVFQSGKDFTPLKVPLVKLDSYAPLADGIPIKLLKIDIEGYEPNALRGMRELAERGMIKNLFCEFNSGWLKRNATTPAQLLEQILSYGFEVHQKTSLQVHPELNGDPYELQDIWFRWSG